MSSSFLNVSAAYSRCRLTLLTTALALSAAAAPQTSHETAHVSTSIGPEASRLTVDVQGVPPPVPVFFSAAVEQTLRFSANEVLGEARVKVHVVQGRPEILSLGLSGDGEVYEVSG